jgi:hypothetical protein
MYAADANVFDLGGREKQISGLKVVLVYFFLVLCMCIYPQEKSRVGHPSPNRNTEFPQPHKVRDAWTVSFRLRKIVST